jgi:hypothetical protein
MTNYRKHIYSPTDYTDKAQKFSIPTTLLGHQSKTTMNIIFFYPKIRQNYSKLSKIILDYLEDNENLKFKNLLTLTEPLPKG